MTALWDACFWASGFVAGITFAYTRWRNKPLDGDQAREVARQLRALAKRCPDCGEASNFDCAGLWHGPDDPWPAQWYIEETKRLEL